MTRPIALAPLACSHLTLEAWAGLADTDRHLLADHLVERLEVAGWELDSPPALRTFGPAGQAQTVLQVRDRGTGLLFSLVPGGTFEPGYGPGLLAPYAEIYQQMEGWKAELDEGEDDEDRWEPESPEQTWAFASERPWDLHRKPAVMIEPVLMACELITPDLPGLHDLVGPLTGYWAGQWRRCGAERRAWQMRWEKVGPVLDHYGWSLPATAEFEWALRGGVDSLFYWGNELPQFLDQEGDDRSDPATTFDAIMSWTFPPDRERTWAWCNRFGLAGMLGAGTWCQPSAELGDPYPLIVRGGAATCYPWQACGEWKLLLNAAEKRLAVSSHYADHNGIRPVVHLHADPDVRLS